jgi:hypothetical protein
MQKLRQVGSGGDAESENADADYADTHGTRIARTNNEKRITRISTRRESRLVIGPRDPRNPRLVLYPRDPRLQRLVLIRVYAFRAEVSAWYSCSARTESPSDRNARIALTAAAAPVSVVMQGTP